MANRLIENHKDKLENVKELIVIYNKMLTTIDKSELLSEKDKRNEKKSINLMLQYLTKVKQGFKDGTADKLIDFSILKN